MSKYTIISKSLRGNRENQVCTVYYQVKGYGATRFQTDLIYLNLTDELGPRYVYLSDRIGKHIETDEDKEVFLQEVYEYQKGGGYRKTHPIIMTNVEVLQKEKRELKDRLLSIDSEIYKAENELRELKYSNYRDDIDYMSLGKYTDKLKEALLPDDRYYIKLVQHIWDGIKFVVMDKELDKAVQIGIYNIDKGIKFRDLESYEIDI